VLTPLDHLIGGSLPTRLSRVSGKARRLLSGSLRLASRTIGEALESSEWVPLLSMCWWSVRGRPGSL
jgi:hypothetical protein